MNRFLATAEQAVREGGEVLAQMLGRVTVREKGPADLVTEADFASQDTVRRIVLGEYPEHGLIGEEDDGEVRPNEEVEYRWDCRPTGWDDKFRPWRTPFLRFPRVGKTRPVGCGSSLQPDER